MVEIRCPKCKSEVEIDEYKENGQHKVAVFCINQGCMYHEHNPLIGIDVIRKEAFITEALI